MKKILFVIAVILLGGIGLGIYQYNANKNQQASPQSAETVPSAKPQTENKGIFGSIQDALSKSLSIQCDFTNEQGKKIMAYMKAGAIRADVTGENGNSTSMILKDNKMSVWEQAKKKGMTIDLQNTKNIMPQAQGGNMIMDSSKELMASLEKFKDKCKPGIVSDSLFTLPADVQFTDLSNTMHPSGMPTINPTLYQQYQQQYQKYQNSQKNQ